MRSRKPASPFCRPLAIGSVVVLYFASIVAPLTLGQDRPSLEQDPLQRVDNTLVPSGQILAPVGSALEISHRPNDVCYSPSLDLAFFKGHQALEIVSVKDWSLKQSLSLPGGASLTGITIDQQNRIYVSNAGNQILIFHFPEDVPNPQADPSPKAEELEEAAKKSVDFKLVGSIDLPSGSFPCGVCLSADQSKLYVCLSLKNQVAEIDLSTSQVTRTFEVGIAPFGITLLADDSPESDAAPSTTAGGHLFVTNIGGRRAKSKTANEAADLTAPSAKTATPVDERGIANTSLVSIIDLGSGQVSGEVAAGLHPSSVLTIPAAQANGDDLVLVTNANDDSLTLIDPKSRKTKTQILKPVPDLPFGSMPNSACLSPDHKFLFVGLAGNNAVAVYSLEEKISLDQGLAPPIGFLPTAWFPAGLTCSETDLMIANLKGIGSRNRRRAEAKGWNSHDHMGQVQKVALSEIANPETLSQWTETVKQQAKVLPLARADESEQASDSSVAPRPIPEKLGQASVFKHVIYVIKENRTYDQIFGDMPEGRGEPSLCTFGEKFSPNHHALAKRFGLLDNYYCNGVLSADGHSWATEGNVTPYLERAFGGFSRSYTFGDDPITYSSSGFLWDHVLAAGLTFRNYGEMDYAEPPAGMKYQEIFAAYEKGEAIEFTQMIGIEKLQRYSCRDYPGWNMVIPDVLRMSRFLKEFETFKQNGTLPNVSIVYLPQDHFGGGVTSGAHMADNDLAIGQLVDAVSHSDYWKDTMIVINEDDPQGGYDHIDGRRSICLVVSAYSKPGVNANFYNQTSVIRTILHIFGIPPMNQQDARSPLMTECFADTADLTPYDVVPANIPLNQKPGEESKQSASEKKWRAILATVPIQRTGMKTPQDEDNLNRFVWHEMMGWDTPYPAQWAGAHGRGLAELGLEADESESD